MQERVTDIPMDLYVGFDIGSSFLNYVVVQADNKVVYAPTPIMHFANPHGALCEAWQDVCHRYPSERIVSTAFTGGGAKAFPEVMPDVTFVFESVAIPKGIETIHPDAAYVFHIGAKDTYFFNMKHVEDYAIIQEWRTGTKCGGGSGTLIEKQCRRLFQGEVPSPALKDTETAKNDAEREQIRISNRQQLQARLETMLARAEAEAATSKEPSDFLARCGVVIQSDLIHKQNEGAQRVDNMAGLFRTIARNYKIDVLGTRQLTTHDRPNYALATGGVMANDLIMDHLAELLGLRIDRAQHYNQIAAIGAAVKAIESRNRFVFDLNLLQKAAGHSRQSRSFAPSLSQAIPLVHDVREELTSDIPQGLDVVIGIDGGSTTTKGALVDLKTGRLLDKLYIKTHGDPEGSLKKVLSYLGRHQDKVNVRGVGATGSARKLYEKILISSKQSKALKEQGIHCSDRITDEITCHAMGVKHNNPDTDTIFEIGGQDMKFTSFNTDGSVKEAKMNYSCQAGSGQTLENMADIINLDVESSLQDAALRAERVPIIDSTCGVFMEMDENRLIAEGFSRDEIAAAIMRGTAASYYYKFVGGAQSAGQVCSAQGGPPLGCAFLAALAQVSEGEIEAYPHREMFGAWGQALDIVEGIKQFDSQGMPYDTAFRGWGLVGMSFDKERTTCSEWIGERTCGIRDCQLEVFRIDGEEIVTGGFCPQGNSETIKKPKTNYLARYHKIFEKHVQKHGSLLADLGTEHGGGAGNEPTIGVKRSTATLGGKGIWAVALLKELGFHPVMSPCSDSDIARLGVDNTRTEFCIARKLTTGHATVLNEHLSVDYLFNPSFIEQRQAEGPDLKYCIYTESEGYILNDVLSLDKVRQLNPVLHFLDEPLLIQEIGIELKRVGRQTPKRKIQAAVEAANAAEQAFKADLYAEGNRFLERIEKQGTPAYVGLGRDYVLLDPEASADSGEMFARTRGLDYIPQIFLEHRFRDVNLDGIVENEFWVESVKILKANFFVAEHPNLYGIRLMNFGCGPDSLKIYQERKIQEAADKPLLVLVTDGQTNNAPFVTRTEAHERVVQQSQMKAMDRQALAPPHLNQSSQRTWLVPFMGNASKMVAASLRSLGVESKALPTNDDRAMELANRHIHTEVCHPLKGVVGDTLSYLHERVTKTNLDFVKDNYMLLLPTTSGPCRFGKYTELVRDFMVQEGFGDVPVIGPTSKTDYVDMPFPKEVGIKQKIQFQTLLFRSIRAADLLEDTYLRFRPYAKDNDEVKVLKEKQLRELEKIVEQGGAIEHLITWGETTVERFKALDLNDCKRFPIVLYIGEIYMRQHDPYTDNVIEKLQDVGLELVRDPVTDWMHYINKLNQRKERRDMRLGWEYRDFDRIWQKSKRYGRSLLKGWYMDQTESKIDEPFHDVLDGRHTLPKPLEMIETLEAAHEMHGNIEGESPLSTSIAYHVMRNLGKKHPEARICGIFHLGPFTCMQESVATAKIEAMVKEFRKKQPDLVFPIIHAFFGDSPNVNLEAEIAVFREQCYQKRDLRHAAKPLSPTIDITTVRQKETKASHKESLT